MHTPLAERTGLLVIRVWVESDPPGRLRGRITQTVDVVGGEELSATASTAEAIEAVVHDWLEHFIRTL